MSAQKTVMVNTFTNGILDYTRQSDGKTHKAKNYRTKGSPCPGQIWIPAGRERRNGSVIFS